MTARDWIEIVSIAIAVVLSVLSFFPDLRKKFADLRASAAQERSSDAHTYESMAETVGSLTRQLKDSLSDIDAMRQSLNIERAERIKLQEQVANSQVAQAAFTRELAEARTTIQELDAALQIEQDARASLQTEMTRMADRMRVLEQENVTLKQENAEYLEALAAYQEGSK